jgi:phospholipase C
MVRPDIARRFGAAVVFLALAGCSSASILSNAGSAPYFERSPSMLAGGKATGIPIQHVVLVVQENRSFDNLFAKFPGANGVRYGKMSNGQSVRLRKHSLVEQCDFGHSWIGFIRDYDKGKMDGFDLEGSGHNCLGKAGRHPYQFVDPQEIQPYWDIAKQYVLADNMFQTQGSGSYTAHQDLIRGATTLDVNATTSLVDYPTQQPWGCDAPPGTTTPILVWTGSKINRKPSGPLPCTKDFGSSSTSYTTLRDLLDATSISWKYYSPAVLHGVGGLWNAFDTIAAVRYGPEWSTNVTTSPTVIFDDISAGTLPAVSWLIPASTNSDHPGDANDNGPSWVASVVNAIGTSGYWNSTAIVVVWDDWGGFYDHVPPPFSDHWGGLGFRVPMLVVSAYARKGGSLQGGYISHTQYEFGSILAFIEDTFNLGRLGTTDVRATGISDCFDFSQPPRKFTMIQSMRSRAYFERQPVSDRPIDSE